MCGICGIINKDHRKLKESSLRTMMQTMKHRGPDDDGVFIHQNTGLGFVRLSILDLSAAGHQPMHSQDGRYTMVFNGEIFNYIELREELKRNGYTFSTQTDTEVLLAAYMEWGKECLHKFNGMWAVAIHDKEKDTLFIARDRYGIKPLYIYAKENQLAFASEIKPLLTLLPAKPKANEPVIFDYLVYNRTDHTEQTFFKDIYKLSHGHYLEIDTRNPEAMQPVRWYDLEKEVNQAQPFKTPEQFAEMFHSSVKLRLRSDVPVGVCLSGGLDSSAIVSSILQTTKDKNLNTFSAVYQKGDRGDESDYIKEYEQSLHAMHYTKPDGQDLLQQIKAFVKAHEEPIPGTSPYAQFKVMELASQNVVVTLDGQGADEMLAGYLYFFGYYFKDLLKNGRLALLLREASYYLKKHKSLYGIKSMFFLLLPPNLKKKARIQEKGYVTEDFSKRAGLRSTITNELYGANTLQQALINHFEYKLEHLLKWEDRNSMWYSLEARVPFLDHRLVERTLATPSGQLIRKGDTKFILREGLRDILPDKIQKRKDKTGFATPEDQWFRLEKWQEFIWDLLESESFKNRGIIDPDKASHLFQKHLENKVQASKEIWKWIHLEMWFREFID